MKGGEQADRQEEGKQACRKEGCINTCVHKYIHINIYKEDEKKLYGKTNVEKVERAGRQAGRRRAGM